MGREQTGVPVTKLFLMYFFWRYQRRYTRLSHTRSQHVPPRVKFLLRGPAAEASPAILGDTDAPSLGGQGRAGPGHRHRCCLSPRPSTTQRPAAAAPPPLSARWYGRGASTTPLLHCAHPTPQPRSAARLRSPLPPASPAHLSRAAPPPCPRQPRAALRRPGRRARAQRRRASPLSLSARMRTRAGPGPERGTNSVLCSGSAAPPVARKSWKSETLCDTAKEEENKSN